MKPCKVESFKDIKYEKGRFFIDIFGIWWICETHTIMNEISNRYLNTMDIIALGMRTFEYV